MQALVENCVLVVHISPKWPSVPLYTTRSSSSITKLLLSEDSWIFICLPNAEKVSSCIEPCRNER